MPSIASPTADESSGPPVDASFSTRDLRRASSASLFATSIEWYDFYVYGTLAALVFPEVFFSSVSPAIGAVLSFASFGVGFLSRPIGALIFGRIGDVVGRKAMLTAALITMGAVSLLIGLVPSFHAIGVAAPLILTLLRFIQGLAVGGQWGGAVLIIAERAPAEKRGLYAGVAQQGVPIGLITSGLAVAILTATLDDAAFASWGWRVPFFIGAALTIIALFMIRQLEDTMAAKGVADSATRDRPRFIELFRTHPKALIVGFTAQLGLTTGAYIQGSYTLNYATEMIDNPVSRDQILWPSIAGSVVSVAGIFFFSRLSDRVGRKVIMLWGFVIAIVWIYPMLLLYGTGSLPLIWLAALVYAIPHSMMFGPLAALLTELFSKRVRATGISFSYQMGGTLGGGISAAVASALFLWTDNILSVAIYTAIALIIGFAGTTLVRENKDQKTLLSS